jgi:hypothetical protein
MTEEQFLGTLKEKSRRTLGHETLEVQTVEQWLAVRREAGLLIDPKTAEVDWIYSLTLDPYRIHPDLPEECRQIGREFFTRSPGSDIWIHFSDLPKSTADELWKTHKRTLSFPAGLEPLIGA